MRSKIKEARAGVEALRLALLSPLPEDIGAALPRLEAAACCLGIVEQELRASSGAADEVRRELKLLKNDLRISARLIEQGMTFCRAWAKLLGTGPAYTQSGRQEPSPSQGIVSLRG